jgi:cytochrome oxidase Cu insertion factor (SCO1/SenC/PrrC family)
MHMLARSTGGGNHVLASSTVTLSCLLVCCAIAGGAVGEALAAGTHLLAELPQEWRDDRGRETRLDAFRGRQVIVTMAYAACRRVCPATMTHLKRLQQEIDSRGESAEFVIVAYDPTVDDPQSWREYRDSRQLTRDNWHFLTGTPAGTEQLARRLGFRFWKYDRHVMHDYRIVVIDAEGALTAEYGPKT